MFGCFLTDDLVIMHIGFSLCTNFDYWPLFNPIALRKAKIVYNFGLSECSRDKMVVRKLVDLLQVHLLLQQYFLLLEQVQKCSIT